jgi:RPA family protein
LTKLGLRLSRARILGTVVDKFISESGKLASITLDDGSDTIRAKVFNVVTMFDNLSIGDVVDVIGRLREYQNEIYIMPEVIAKIDDPNFELLRYLEIKRQNDEWQNKRNIIFDYQKQASDISELKKVMKEQFNIPEDAVEAILQVQEAEPEEEEPNKEIKDKVLGLISELDKGDGCDYSMLMEKSGLAEDLLDSIINDILSEGLCFEPRPGKIKRL